MKTASEVRAFYRSLEGARSKSALPYVYAAFHKRRMTFYFGFRCANKLPAQDDLGVTYFSSSSKVRDNPEDYYFVALRIFRSKDAAYRFEQKLIKENIDSPRCLNLHWQRTGIYSMLGMKRPDLAKLNTELKTVGRVIETYVCKHCKCEFHAERTAGAKRRVRTYCSRQCSSSATSKGRVPWSAGLKGTGEIVAWNKGLSSSWAAANGKAGAEKMSKIASNRRMAVRKDGTRYWKSK